MKCNRFAPFALVCTFACTVVAGVPAFAQSNVQMEEPQRKL